LSTDQGGGQDPPKVLSGATERIEEVREMASRVVWENTWGEIKKMLTSVTVLGGTTTKNNICGFISPS